MSAHHQAIVAPKLGAPLQAVSVPTPAPGADEVLVRVLWASPTPFDNWQRDFGLVVSSWPLFLGENAVGTVVALGAGVSTLSVGDTVFGFTHGAPRVKAFQEYAALPARRLGRVPARLDARAAATVPDNFVTAWWALTEYLRVALPEELPARERPAGHDEPILIWGGATSVGQYAIQLLKQAGYTNVITTASPRNAPKLAAYGARAVIDYRAPDVGEKLRAAADGRAYAKVLDCVAHDAKSIALYRALVAPDGVAALLLPVQLSDAAGKVVGVGLEAEGFPQAQGVRTHYYQENKELYEKLQPEIMPRLFGAGVIEANAARVVEGETLLERVEESLRMLREGLVSGEKLVFAVGE